LPDLLNPSRHNRFDDFMLKKQAERRRGKKTKLGLCRFRPIINTTIGAEPVFREIKSRSTKALNSMPD
jgi:hypothetical protein